MITDELFIAAKDQIFVEEAAHHYAVLDGASIPGLLEKLYGLQPEHACLFSGELEPDIEEVAPYVVRLDYDSEFADWLIGDGWGDHWGIFATSDAELWQMRRHLKKFLRVYDAEGKAMLFRYYDPRVLRLYLPTCNAAELETVFGPVTSYALEADDPNKLLRFRLNQRKLEQESVLLEPKDY